MFLIFFNEFEKQLEHCETIMFVDDSILYFGSKDINTIKKGLKDDIKSISDYLSGNKL